MPTRQNTQIIHFNIDVVVFMCDRDYTIWYKQPRRDYWTQALNIVMSDVVSEHRKLFNQLNIGVKFWH